jgi:hypothetical protein
MKKQHLFIILVVVLLGFVFGVIQYYQALKTEDVSAVTVGIPNPGHSLAQLECSADSLCVDTTNNRVGIGTANPGVQLELANSGANAKIRLNYVPSSYQTTYLADIYYDGTLTNNEGLVLQSSGSAVNNGKVLINPYGGNVGIGTTTPGAKLQINSPVNSYPTSAVPSFSFRQGSYPTYGWDWIQDDQINGNLFLHKVNAGVSTVAMSFDRNTGNVGIGTTTPGYTLTVAGTAWVTSGSWSGSDIRWKKNINTLSQSSSLEKVMALNPVTYDWRVSEFPEMKFSNGSQLGFIAQDVEKIIPEVVTTNNEGYKGISYEKIVPVLTSAIQEQEGKIEQLKKIVCLDHPLIEMCK